MGTLKKHSRNHQKPLNGIFEGSFNGNSLNEPFMKFSNGKTLKIIFEKLSMETIEQHTLSNEFIEKQRIKIPVELYERKAYGAITDIIGTNCVIKNVERLPIIQDNNYIFDISFTRLSLNPLKFYIIDTSDLKLISEYSTDYYTKIDNISVKINANMQEDDLKKNKQIMIQVNKTLSTDQVNHDYFKYYGTIVKNPLHDYISILGMTYGYRLNTTVPENLQDCPVEIFRDDEIEMEYTRFLSNTIYGKQYSLIEDISEQNQITSKSICYRISALKINQFPINGIVFISKKRKNIYDVVIGINNNFSVSYPQWLTILNFLSQEYTNYSNFIKVLQ